MNVKSAANTFSMVTVAACLVTWRPGRVDSPHKPALGVFAVASYDYGSFFLWVIKAMVLETSDFTKGLSP